MGSPYFFLSLSLFLPFPLLLPLIGILASPRAGLSGRFLRRRPARVLSLREPARRAGNFPRRPLLAPGERMRPDVTPTPPRGGRPVSGPGAEGGAEIAPRAAGGRAGAARAVSVRVSGGTRPCPGAGWGDRDKLAPARGAARRPGAGRLGRREVEAPSPQESCYRTRSGRPASFAASRVPAAHPPISSRPACVAAAA